jgi:hypothetical protein
MREVYGRMSRFPEIEVEHPEIDDRGDSGKEPRAFK